MNGVYRGRKESRGGKEAATVVVVTGWEQAMFSGATRFCPANNEAPAPFSPVSSRLLSQDSKNKANN